MRCFFVISLCFVQFDVYFFYMKYRKNDHVKTQGLNQIDTTDWSLYKRFACDQRRSTTNGFNLLSSLGHDFRLFILRVSHSIINLGLETFEKDGDALVWRCVFFLWQWTSTKLKGFCKLAKLRCKVLHCYRSLPEDEFHPRIAGGVQGDVQGIGFSASWLKENNCKSWGVESPGTRLLLLKSFLVWGVIFHGWSYLSCNSPRGRVLYCIKLWTLRSLPSKRFTECGDTAMSLSQMRAFWNIWWQWPLFIDLISATSCQWLRNGFPYYLS